MPSLSSPLRDVIGDKASKVLAKHLDLHTAGDLLRHYPRRYAERGVLTALNELRVDDYVTVRDNGRGIDPMAPKGLGSLGMRERVEGLGGDYTIESAPGQGTCLRVVIPLRVKESDARNIAASKTTT